MPMIAWWILMERDQTQVELVARSIFQLYKLGVDQKSEKTGLYRAKQYLQESFSGVKFNVSFDKDFKDINKTEILPENETKAFLRKEKDFQRQVDWKDRQKIRGERENINASKFRDTRRQKPNKKSKSRSRSREKDKQRQRRHSKSRSPSRKPKDGRLREKEKGKSGRHGSGSLKRKNDDRSRSRSRSKDQ